MRHTRSHTKKRRSHHALGKERLSKCPACGTMHLAHHVCQNCGAYRGKELINVLKKVEKREKKKKEKEKEAH